MDTIDLHAEPASGQMQIRALSDVESVQALTPDTLDRLIDLVHTFARDGICWDAGTPATITPETEAAACAFLRALAHQAPTVQAPRLSPDGEGALMAVWELGGESLALTIDGWSLHLVAGMGTSAVQHIDNVPFSTSGIPESIRRLYPSITLEGSR